MSEICFIMHNGFLNGEMLPFSEVGQMMGISQTDWSWSPLFADYDNDGDKDLLISNGFPRDETDKDWTRLKATAAGFYASDEILISMAPAIKIPNLAFENEGKNRLHQEEMTGCLRFLHIRMELLLSILIMTEILIMLSII